MLVNFYVLASPSAHQSLHFACQLIEKAYVEQKRVYVNLNNPEEANRFDALLWTYRDDSFIPHQIYNHADTSPPPVQIGCSEVPANHHDILINLTREIPGFYQQFSEVIEIVFADPIVQQLARDRFKQYRDQGCEVNTYKLKENES